MNNEIREDKQRNYLLVEGNDDAGVFYNLLQHHQLHERITIIDKKGIHNLLATLNDELIRSGLERLGIVVDADIDLAARWQSLRDKLIRSGYNAVPAIPDTNGTIIEQVEQPTVGIWLMPDNKVPGMLENFVSFLVPQSDTLWPITEDILQRVIAKDRRFPPTQTIKAHLHTWLAWQEEPGKPMGQAITKRYLKAEALHAQQLMAWIHQLFNLEPMTT